MAVEGFQYTHVCETCIIIVLSRQLGVWGKCKNHQMGTFGLSVSTGILSGCKVQEQESFVLLIGMKFSNFLCVCFPIHCGIRALNYDIKPLKFPRKHRDSTVHTKQNASAKLSIFTSFKLF